MIKKHNPGNIKEGLIGWGGKGGLYVSRQECLMDMAGFFEKMQNAERQLQELPLLFLRQGAMTLLFELVTSQQALRYMGPRQVLRYIQASDWSLENVGSTLKTKFEKAFAIEIHTRELHM